VQTREVECIDDGAAAEEPKPPPKKCSQPPPAPIRECNATLCRPCEVWQASPRILNTSEGWLSDGDGQYGNNLNCIWLIKPPTQGTLVLRFHTLSLERDHDFLRVYDGLEPVSGKLLGFISGDPIAEPVLNPIMGAGPYRAGSGSMFLRLSSDNWRTAEGFVASWTVEPYTAEELAAIAPAMPSTAHVDEPALVPAKGPTAEAGTTTAPATAPQPPSAPNMAAAPSQQTGSVIGVAPAAKASAGQHEVDPATPSGGAEPDARGMLLKVGRSHHNYRRLPWLAELAATCVTLVGACHAKTGPGPVVCAASRGHVLLACVWGVAGHGPISACAGAGDSVRLDCDSCCDVSRRDCTRLQPHAPCAVAKQSRISA
jgi:hypothetical protein